MTISRITLSEVAPRPIVKEMHPNLYSKHTAHMRKAALLSYNYSNLDDFMVLHFSSKTMKEIAKETNEYFERVAYRAQVLKQLGLIKNKRKPISREIYMLTMEMKRLHKRIEQIKQTMADIKARKQLKKVMSEEHTQHADHH